MNVEQSVERLNELLKGEFAAIGSYRQTIERVPDTELKTQLEEIHVAHEARANHLRARVQELGGEPFEGETCWQKITPMTAVAESYIGEKIALLALGEKENAGVQKYQEVLNDLDEDSRELILNELLPAQEQTLSTLEGIRKGFLS
ncbi:MAG: DUF2383 domain-containing protein [Candidatus Obscuribacter sp.]|nr:DUF2383 domain-containing protein [Candidatus Obscuribacter sp.]MBP6349463.1 DUF2383 domain-containing protein [Candidatus Obscuribacter sp.]MBP6594386.1 DUF2383 domain-containing protein [Candidatus Obscuribacter sp.]